MKKLIFAILCISLLVVSTGCSERGAGSVVPVSNDTLYKSCLTLLQQGNGYVEASCPSSRESLNGRIEATPSLLTKLAQILTSYKLTPSARERVPGSNRELVLQFGEDNGLRVFIYSLKDENETLIWLQNSSERLRLSAEGALYSELEAELNSAVVSCAPAYDGEYTYTATLSGRDVPRGFYEKGGVLAAAFSSYDLKGYLDFYSAATGELLSSLEFDEPLYRLDEGKNKEARVFSGGKLYYIDMAKREIKQEYVLEVTGIDAGDSFDVDEGLKIAAYSAQGTVYLCSLNGENSVPVMFTSDVSRALPTEISMQLELEEAVLKYNSPRFLNNVLCASVSSTLASHPLVAMSSFQLEKDIAKMLDNEEFMRRLTDDFTAVHFPNIFGTMGSHIGFSASTAITANDSSYVFSNMLSGEGWQLPFAWGQRVVALNGGFICTQTKELAQDSLRHRVDISKLSSYSEKTQVFAATATNLEVLGGTDKTVVMRESAANRLLFVDLTRFEIAG